VNFVSAQREELVELRRSLLVESSVELVGCIPMEETAEFFCGSDVFVVSSLSENGPQAGIEAMAAELPVIATPVGAMWERNEGKEEGLFVHVGAVPEIADLMVGTANNSALTSRLGTTARQEYLLRFHSNHREARLFGVYECLLSGRRPADRLGRQLAG